MALCVVGIISFRHHMQISAGETYRSGDNARLERVRILVHDNLQK